MIDINNLKQGSFKGAEFEVEEADLSFGRRVASYVYPKSDRSETEDMGQVPDKFTIRCLVVDEDDTREKERKLVEVLSEPSSGTLVDPFFYPIFGAFTARSGEVKLRHRNNEHGVARFDIEFHRVEDESPRIAPLPSANAPSLFDRAKEGFLSVYDVISIPARLINEFREEFEQVTQGIRDSVKAAAATATEIGNIEIALAQLESSIDETIAAPNKAASLIEDSINVLRDALNDDLKRIESLKGFIQRNDEPLIDIVSRATLNLQKENVRVFKKSLAVSLVTDIALAHQDRVTLPDADILETDISEAVALSRAIITIAQDIEGSLEVLIQNNSNYPVIIEVLSAKTRLIEARRASLEFLEKRRRVYDVKGFTNTIFIANESGIPIEALNEIDPILSPNGELEVFI